MGGVSVRFVLFRTMGHTVGATLDTTYTPAWALAGFHDTGVCTLVVGRSGLSRCSGLGVRRQVEAAASIYLDARGSRSGMNSSSQPMGFRCTLAGRPEEAGMSPPTHCPGHTPSRADTVQGTHPPRCTLSRAHSLQGTHRPGRTAEQGRSPTCTPRLCHLD